MNYLEIINQPMDLKTIGEQLQVGNYATPSDFADAIRPIFENLKNFDSVRNLSKTIELSVRFEDQLRNILTSYETRRTTTGCKCEL